MAGRGGAQGGNVIRRRRGALPPSRDRWLLSYADFITLLFAFFATLYAASTVDARKLSGIAEGMQEAFADAPAVTPSVLPTHTGIVGPAGNGARAAIERELGLELADRRLELTEDRRGLVLSIPEAGSFSPGRADMALPAEQFMGRLAAALRQTSSAIRVEGHTDDLPIHNDRFMSNWELSTARATRVVQFLIAEGVAPGRLSAAGYSEFHPRAVNGSAEGRARNRRVDIVVLNSETQQSEEPAAESAP
jgi:chemotaxis protein MotB